MLEVVEGVAAHFRELGYIVKVVNCMMEITEPGNWRNFILLFDDHKIETIGDPDHDARVMNHEQSLFDGPWVDLADPGFLEAIEAAVRRRTASA